MALPSYPFFARFLFYGKSGYTFFVSHAMKYTGVYDQGNTALWFSLAVSYTCLHVLSVPSESLVS
jgi:hypothetical protein